jgi:hypothetical protein
VNDTGADDDEFEDGRKTKDRFQKIQLMEIFTLIFTIASSGISLMNVI